jgi:hypothetical protein
MKRAFLFVVCAALCGAQTTVNGGRDYKGTLKASGSVSAVDFSSAAATAPARAGTTASRPAGCTQGQIYFATDVTAGQNLYFCTVTGTPGVWTQMSGSTSGGGGGAAAYISSLLPGPDLTRTITGATHGFATTALMIAVYDNASPRNVINVAYAINPTTYDVTITFASPQSNYYVVVNGGVGPQGPMGPQGPGGGGTPGGTSGQMQINSGGSFAGQTSIFSGGTLAQRAVECTSGTTSYNALTAAAPSQEITIQTEISGNVRWDHVTISETTQFAGTTGLTVSMGRPGTNNNEMTGAQIPLMVSSGDGNSWTSRPIPPQLTGTYSLVLNFAVASGNVNAATAGSLTWEACGYSVR